MFRPLKFVALLLAACWLPATLHCQLERLGGLEAIFACANAAGSADHDKGADCTDDGCLTIEAGQVAIAKSRLDTNLQPVLCVCFTCFVLVAPPTVAPTVSVSRQDELLPLQRTWQFDRRAALPARAPDSLNAARA